MRGQAQMMAAFTARANAPKPLYKWQNKNFFIPRRKVLFSLLLLLCYSRVIGASPDLKLPVVRFLGFLAFDLQILSFVF